MTSPIGFPNGGAGAVACCPAPIMALIEPTAVIWVEFSAFIGSATPTSCCISCGTATMANGDTGSPDPDAIVVLRSRACIGKAGDATSFGLPDWSLIGTRFGIGKVTQTNFDALPALLAQIPASQLVGIQRRALQLPRNAFPRVHPTILPSLPQLILHEGLARKLARSADSAHLKLPSKTIQTAQQPFEVWSDVDDSGKPIVRFLSRYAEATTGAFVNHLVVMEEDTGIGVTQYLRRNAQIVADRQGTLLYLGWAELS